MADNKYVQELKELQKNKAVQTLMYVVPWAEGSVDRNTPRERAYYRLFGFNKDGSGRFADNLDIFPDSPGYYRDPKTGQIKTSSDAGLYQLNKMNIARLQKKIGRTDFSPETQDLMFLALLDEQPGFRKRVNQGNVDNWGAKDYQELYGIVGRVYDSFPNGPGSGAKRSMDFLMNKTNEFIQQGGGKALAYTPTQQSTATTASGNNRAVPTYFTDAAYAQAGRGSFFDRAMSNIRNKSYADAGRVPFETTNSNVGNRTVFGSINEDPQVLLGRLFDKDPNTTYGLSYVGNGLRPTISRLDPDGNRVDMIEMANGKLINAVTGEQMNSDGTVYEGTPVEYLTPDYEAPQNSPEAMEALRRNNELQAAPMSLGEETVVVAPDRAYLDYEGKINPTTAEAALPSGSTPPTTGNAASPVAYVDPNEATNNLMVAAIGGDKLARTINGTKPVLANAGALIDLA